MATKKSTTKTAKSDAVETKSVNVAALSVDEKHEARVAAQAEGTQALVEAQAEAKSAAAPEGAKAAKKDRTAADQLGSTANRAAVNNAAMLGYESEFDLVPDKTFFNGQASTEEAKVDVTTIHAREAEATESLFAANGAVSPGGYRGHGSKQDEWDRLEATRLEFRDSETDAAAGRQSASAPKETTRTTADVWYADEGGRLQSQGHSVRSLLGKYFSDVTDEGEKNRKISDVMNSNSDLVKSGRVKELFDKI